MKQGSDVMSASLDEPPPAAFNRGIERANLFAPMQSACFDWAAADVGADALHDARPLPPCAPPLPDLSLVQRGFTWAGGPGGVAAPGTGAIAASPFSRPAWRGYKQTATRFSHETVPASVDASTRRAPPEGGDLLTTASHEIRTPMYGLLGMIDMTLETELDPIQRHYMTLARASAASLATLVNDLLDLSKLQAGHFTITSARCDLHRLLDESLGIFSMRAASRNIAFFLCCPADLPQWIDIDATRLLQVLTNLVGNAIKFTSEGHVGVTVAMEQIEGRSHLRLSVLDTGPGISKADQQRIFQPFAQFHGASSGAIPNTGLGLTITRSIIGAMGGKALVSSELGVGSCFEAILPAPVHPVATCIPVPLGATVALCVDQELERQQYAHWLSAMGCLCVGPDELYLADAMVCDVPAPRVLPVRVPTVLLLPPTSPGPALSDDAVESGRCVSVHKPLSPWRLQTALCSAMGRGEGGSDNEPDNSEWSRLVGSKVLLIDDDSVSALVTQSMLEMVGVLVTSTSNARDAVCELMRHEFDVVLTDLRLPLMDGYELSLWIRDFERGRAPATKSIIIALSASTAPAERQRCLDVGMDDFVAKPVLREHLYAVLLRHTEKRGPQSPAHFFVNTTYDLDT